MSTAWITNPPIPYSELEKAELPGLTKHYDDKGEWALTDGKNYLWVDNADGNATFMVFVDTKNKVQGIQEILSKAFDVEWKSEHDEGFWDEDDAWDAEHSIPADEANESGKFKGKMSMNLLRIAARIAAEEPEYNISFTGTLHSKNNGESVAGEGKITVDGAEHELKFSGSPASEGEQAFDTIDYIVDGQQIDVNSPLHEHLDLYFIDIWPSEDGDWDATVENGVIANAPVEKSPDGIESIAARIAAPPPKKAPKPKAVEPETLTFSMPGDQDWDPGLWERIGIGPEWKKFADDLKKLGCEMDDTEDINLTFPPKSKTKVWWQIEAARDGKYGPDVQAYWSAAVEESEAAEDADNAANLADDFPDAVFMGIQHPKGMPSEEAIKRAKALIPCKTGEFDIGQEEEDWLVGNMECEAGYYEKNPDGADYGPDDAGVEVSWETP
jgi:hypothetical protein